MTSVKVPGAAPTRLSAMGSRLQATTRRRLCAWLGGALLLMHWLVVAHACDSLPTQMQVQVQVHAHADVQAIPCQGDAAPGDLALCKAQCTDEDQAPLQALGADLPPPVGGGLVAVLLQVPRVTPGPWPARMALMGEPPGWPPLYLAYGVLRI